MDDFWKEVGGWKSTPLMFGKVRLFVREPSVTWTREFSQKIGSEERIAWRAMLRHLVLTAEGKPAFEDDVAVDRVLDGNPAVALKLQGAVLAYLPDAKKNISALMSAFATDSPPNSGEPSASSATQ